MSDPIPVDIAELPELVPAGAVPVRLRMPASRSDLFQRKSKAAKPGVRKYRSFASCTVVIRQGPAINEFNAAAALVVPRRAVVPIGEREEKARQKRWLIESTQFRACIRAT